MKEQENNCYLSLPFILYPSIDYHFWRVYGTQSDQSTRQN